VHPAQSTASAPDPMASQRLFLVIGLCLLPLALAFSPSVLNQVTSNTAFNTAQCQLRKSPLVALRRPAAAALFMADEAADAPATEAEAALETVAGVTEETDEEQRSLKKTRTNKRPRTANKDKKPLTDFEVGSTVPGKVVSIMPYGAFVDIGTTTDGLVHVSQLADEFVSDASEIVSVGDEVQVRIVEIQEDKNKVSLSMRSEQSQQKQGGSGRGGGKNELPEELKNLSDKEFIKGTVASVMNFGAFVTIAEGVDGLVHVSQMSEERNIDAEKFVKVGQEVQVRITQYDAKRKRLSLSMKAWTEPEPRDETEDIRGYVDDEIEGAKTSFQVAWERAQAKASV